MSQATNFAANNLVTRQSNGSTVGIDMPHPQTIFTVQVDRTEVDRLQEQINDQEFIIGQLAIHAERSSTWHQKRLKTIAREHANSIKKMNYAHWKTITRGLIRFLSTLEGSDARSALEILRAV